MPTPSGVGFAQDPAVTPGLGHTFVLVVVVVVRTGRPLPTTAHVGVQLTLCDTLWSHCDLGSTKVTV